jgi:hypothetical protein
MHRVEITLTWFVLMGGISLKVATVGSGLGDCRVLRENLSNDLGKNLDNLLGDSFLEGGRENSCNHDQKQHIVVKPKVHTSLAALRPFSSAK